jgi:hypothetical protein
MIVIKLIDTGEILELDSELSTILTYSVKDMRELNFTNGSMSKTLYLKGDDRTNRVLKSIFNINNDLTFDTNKKVAALLVDDDIEYIRGYFQILKITYDERFVYIYEVIIYDEVVNFFLDLGENYLTRNFNIDNDLDFSQWNHILTIDAITQSHANYRPEDLPYVYTAFDSPNDIRLNVSEYIPSFYIKAIWDEIFYKWGIRYQSDFLRSEYFSKMVMPWNGSNYTLYAEEFDTIVGVTNSCIHFVGNRRTTTGGDEVYANVEGIGLKKVIDINNDLASQNITIPGIYGVSPQSQTGGSSRINLPFNMSILRTISNEFVCADTPNHLVDRVSLPYWTSPIIGKMSLSFNVNLRIDYKKDFSTPLYAKIPNGIVGGSGPGSGDLTFTDNPPLKVNVHLCKNPGLKYVNTDMIQNSVGYITLTDVYPNLLGGTGVTSSYFNISGEFNNIEVFRNEWFFLVFEVETSTSYYDAPGGSVGYGYANGGNRADGQSGNPTPKIRFVLGDLTSESGILRENKLNIYYDQFILAEGNLIKLNSFLPEEYKQKDFITSLVKMFNLYICPVVGKEKEFLIEPRDQFYSKGEIINVREK